MRHRNKTNSLSRTSAHRKAMLSNMSSSLILHKRIKTTVAKAKALRVYVEPLINRSKDDSTQSRRVVFSHLQNKEAVSELFREEDSMEESTSFNISSEACCKDIKEALVFLPM